MKRKFVLWTALACACAIIFAGCATQPSSDLQVIQPSASAGQAEDAAKGTGESTLTVNATETVKVAPDVAYVTIGVTTKGKTAAEAQQENARITTEFLNAVKQQGVAEEDMQTSNINVYTDYDDSSKTVVDNSYRITIRDVNNVGAVIDAALAAGANSTYSLSFDVEDRDAVYIQALAKAMESVGEKAKTVAMAGGYSIVKPLSITESGADYGVRYAESMAMDSAMEAGGAATPVTPQDIEVSASVSGTYVIQ